MKLEKLIFDKMVETFPTTVHMGMFGDYGTLAEHKDDIVGAFKYLPEENKQRILDTLPSINPNSVETFGEICIILSGKGCFDFEPWIVKEETRYPSLMLGIGAYLHFSRGRFTQSYTEAGRISLDGAPERLDSVLKGLSSVDIYNDDDDLDSSEYCAKSRLPEIMTYINCCLAGAYNTPFLKLLEDKPEVVDKFVKVSRRDYMQDNNLTYRELKELLCVSKSASGCATKRPTVKLTRHGTDYCTLHVTSLNEITTFTHYKNMGEVTWRLPDIVAPEGYTVDVPKDVRKSMFLHLCAFALLECGFLVNYLVAYTVYQPSAEDAIVLDTDCPTLETLNRLCVMADKLLALE